MTTYLIASNIEVKLVMINSNPSILVQEKIFV